jgi:hypothetical protein
MTAGPATPITRRLLLATAIGGPPLLLAMGAGLVGLSWLAMELSPKRPPTEAELAAVLRSDAVSAALGDPPCSPEVQVSRKGHFLGILATLEHTEACGRYTVATHLSGLPADRAERALDRLTLLGSLGASALPVIPDLPMRHACVATQDPPSTKCVVLSSGVTARYRLRGPTTTDHLRLRDLLLPRVEALADLPHPEWPEGPP